MLEFDAGGDSRTNLRKIISDVVVLVVGHSARDVYEKPLGQNVLLISKDSAYYKFADEVQSGNGNSVFRKMVHSHQIVDGRIELFI